MHTSRAEPHIVDASRLDPEYYHPKYLAQERVLRTFGVKSLGTIGKFFAGPFGSRLPSHLYLNEGIPLFRVGNIGAMEVCLDGMAYLHPSVHLELSASEVVPGDLLIVKASVGEKICKVPDSMPRANITQHIISVRTHGKVDVDCIAAFLFSRYGRGQLVRRSLGSIIQYLGISDAKSVLYPVISLDGQRYIGDKVRQAERLRQMSRERSAYALQLVNAFLADEKSVVNLEHEVSKLLDGDVLTDERLKQIESNSARKPNQRSKCSRIPKNFLTTRLDCNFYNRDALELDMRFAQGYEVATFSDVVDQSRQITNGVRGPDVQPSLFKLVRLQDFAGWSIDFDSCLTISESQFRENRRCQLQEGDVVVAIGGYIGHAAMARRVQTAVIGQHSAMLPMGTNSKVDAGFLVAFLNSNAGAIQLQRYVSGTVQVGVNLEDLRQIRLPLPSSVLQKHIGDAIRQADNCSHWASRLLNMACRLVEALIEGQITVNELCEAYVALNEGDRQADSSILERMTVGGLDMPHESPLFPDLDGLYAAIDEAERAHTDGETS